MSEIKYLREWDSKKNYPERLPIDRPCPTCGARTMDDPALYWQSGHWKVFYCEGTPRHIWNEKR